MITANEPARFIKAFWQIVKYVLFPVGFILLLGRVGVKLLGFAVNNYTYSSQKSRK
jgi:hypothetical protein